MDWKIDFIKAKYHLSVAKRMLDKYLEYPEKRFLVGIINESAKSASSLIRSFLVYEITNNVNKKYNKKHFGLKYFIKIAPKYLKTTTLENLLKLLEVERAQKISPIEFSKGEKIILLIHGKYRVLTARRIREFANSVEQAIFAFPGNFRQV
jgi:hypothetical protein